MIARELATRRVWLRVLAAALGVASGCGTRTETGRGDGATSTAQQTRPPRETTATATETARQTQTPDTQTDTPTPDTETDTPTPEESTPLQTEIVNWTDYAVRWLLGFADDRITGFYQGSLLDGEKVRVQLLTSRQEWQTIRRMIEEKVDASYENVPFVAETNFGAESLVAVWVDMTNREYVRLVDVTREGTRTVRLRVKAVGSFGAQVRVGRILLVRVPNGQRLTQAVVEYLDDERELTVVTDEERDESATETATNDTERQLVQPAGSRVHR